MSRLPFLQEGDNPACSDNPNLFFAKEPSKSNSREVDWINEICGGCPFRVGCAEYAIQRSYLDGWWGGMSPAMRAKARSMRGVAPVHDPYTRSRAGYPARDWVKIQRGAELAETETRMKALTAREMHAEQGLRLAEQRQARGDYERGAL